MKLQAAAQIKSGNAMVVGGGILGQPASVRARIASHASHQRCDVENLNNNESRARVDNPQCRYLPNLIQSHCSPRARGCVAWRCAQSCGNGARTPPSPCGPIRRVLSRLILGRGTFVLGVYYRDVSHCEACMKTTNVTGMDLAAILNSQGGPF